jgi:hypothetical protein
MNDAPTPAELEVLARQAGLDRLPAEYTAELLSAYTHLTAMLARLPHARPHADEPAHVFVPTTFARPARMGEG